MPGFEQFGFEGPKQETTESDLSAEEAQELKRLTALYAKGAVAPTRSNLEGYQKLDQKLQEIRNLMKDRESLNE
jgi:hypothetical protein